MLVDNIQVFLWSARGYEMLSRDQGKQKRLLLLDIASFLDEKQKATDCQCGYLEWGRANSTA